MSDARFRADVATSGASGAGWGTTERHVVRNAYALGADGADGTDGEHRLEALEPLAR